MIETKYFTRAEAENTLPLVRQIVKDIINTAQEMRLMAKDIKGNFEEDPIIQRKAGEIDGFMQELEEIGCLYKDWDFTIGLVDFPAIIDGREVYLCWRSDEENISFFHDMDKGFNDRKPLDQEHL